MTARDYYQREREYKPKAADTVGKPHIRFAVLCWDTIHAYAHNRPADVIVCVVAASAEAAQDYVRGFKGPFDAYETRPATAQDEEAGMTPNDFRNRYNTR